MIKPLPITKLKKFFPMMIAVYLLLLSAVLIFRAELGLKHGLILKVSAVSANLRADKTYQLSGGNNFDSGVDGDLFWKPRTLIESVLLVTTKNDSADLFDIIGAAIFAGIVYAMFSRSDDTALFNKKMLSGFGKLIFAICSFGTLVGIARLLFAFEYIPYITHGQFDTNYSFNGFSFYYSLMPFLVLLFIIPQKGLELQQQQELTI